MTPQQRIRLARRHAGLSQAALGAAVGVQRSAVGHWEAARGKFPSVAHLREIALVTGVQFEWLATGRGSMGLSADTALDSVAAADAVLVEDPLELRLLAAFRAAPTRSRAPLVEVVEQLAELRTGRARVTAKTARV
ncbi:helix-turn-helix domain-containing protein [Lysobacter soli]|uniref:helix-turn-helix transcriptional regulator n=1 Tax=Lysobacter soli TaxID=453783 RepID=UPI0012EDFA61|nr:helix-turn-helix transcriptional regulator [Lysobacter soli]QGW66344.1 helix-turn-helix domain-containing protein [Lysobacter soli]